MTIPADVWTNVAQFIPDQDLRAMFGINSAFFQLAMDARYRVVRFWFWSPPNYPGAFKCMQRLRDPAIAHRVRQLDVAPYIHKDPLTHHYDPGSDPTTHDIITSLQENLQTMTDTVACLSNVKDFSIEMTRRLPFEWEDILPFFTMAWKAFGSNLRKVSFRVWWKHLSTLLPIADGLITLKALSVDLQPLDIRHLPDWMIGVERDDRTVMTTTLITFINKVSPSLHTLSLISYEFFELTPLFFELRNIPNLERFTFFIDYNLDILTDHSSLTRFLRSHAQTLRYIHWISGPMITVSHDGRTKPQCMMDWLSDNEHDEVIFSNLTTLRMPVPGDSAGFHLIMHYIRRSAATLRSLELWDHSLSYDEVHTLVSALSLHEVEHLQELSLEVKFLSPEHILLMAQRLPFLEKINISTIYVVTQNEGAERNIITHQERLLNVRKFADTVKTYDIRHWTLHDLEITVFSDSEIALQVMRALADCIPSVTRFGSKDAQVRVMDTEDEHKGPAFGSLYGGRRAFANPLSFSKVLLT